MKSIKEIKNIIPDKGNKYIGESIVIKKPGTIERSVIEFNDIREDEVLVKMKGCSLHDEDISCWEGSKNLTYPLHAGMPGKEGWGVVVKAGELTNVKKGDLVAVLSDKSLSEYIVCNQLELVKLPSQFKELDFPLEAFAYAFYLFRQAKISSEDTVVLLGKGFLSNVIKKLANDTGASVFTVANKKTKTKVRELQYNWHDADKIRNKIKQITDGKGCDRVIEFTGSQHSIEFANKILNSEGMLLLTKVPDSTIKIDKEDNCSLHLFCANDLSLNKRIENICDVEDTVLEGLDPKSFITHTIKFKDAEKAFDLICRNPKDYIKCVITFD